MYRIMIHNVLGDYKISIRVEDSNKNYSNTVILFN